MVEKIWIFIIVAEKFMIAPLLLLACLAGIAVMIRLAFVKKTTPNAISATKLLAYQGWLAIAILTVGYFALFLLLLGFNC